MKNVLLAFSVLAAMAACNGVASSGNNEVSSDSNLTDSLKFKIQKDTTNYTTIKWLDSTFHDLGKVKKGQQVEIPFELENAGEHPLIITMVQPGCGCTVAEKPEKPIMPGKKDKIVAKFNSEGQSVGDHIKSITVTANTKPSTSHTLEFKVNVTE